MDRSPARNPQFFKAKSEMFHLDNNGEQIIFGDLNLDLEDPSRDDTVTLTRIMDKNSYTQLVRKTRRKAGGTLDLCQARSEELPVVGSLTILNDTISKVSNHSPFIVDISTNPCLVQNENKKTFQIRILSEAVAVNLKNELNDLETSEIL